MPSPQPCALSNSAGCFAFRPLAINTSSRPLLLLLHSPRLPSPHITQRAAAAARRDVGFGLSLPPLPLPPPPLRSSGGLIVLIAVPVFVFLPLLPSSSFPSSSITSRAGPCSSTGGGRLQSPPLRPRRHLGNRRPEGLVQLDERDPPPPWETSGERATRAERRLIRLRHLHGGRSYEEAAKTMYIVVCM